MKIIAFLGVLLLFGLFCNMGYAQVDPCEKDRAKYCVLYGPKDPLRLYCLKFYESQISSPCKLSLKSIKNTSGEFIEECTEDYHKFCSDVRQGEGRVLECLRSHSKELDFECRKQVHMLPKH